MAEEMTFGEAMQRLEDITSKLESGELELEEALEQFEEGVRLIKTLQEKLSGARSRVERLVESIEGSLEAEPFAEEEEGEDEGEEEE